MYLEDCAAKKNTDIQKAIINRTLCLLMMMTLSIVDLCPESKCEPQAKMHTIPIVEASREPGNLKMDS